MILFLLEVVFVFSVYIDGNYYLFYYVFLVICYFYCGVVVKEMGGSGSCDVSV